MKRKVNIWKAFALMFLILMSPVAASAQKKEIQTAKDQVKAGKNLDQALVDKGFRIVSGGTDNHLMLVDLRPKHTTGKEVATALDKALITVNKNMIPFDPEKPMVTSGIRIGTPAITTRGMKEPEMLKIADFINRAVENRNDDAALAAIAEEVKAFTAAFPLPQF